MVGAAQVGKQVTSLPVSFYELGHTYNILELLATMLHIFRLSVLRGQWMRESCHTPSLVLATEIPVLPQICFVTDTYIEIAASTILWLPSTSGKAVHYLQITYSSLLIKFHLPS